MLFAVLLKPKFQRPANTYRAIDRGTSQDRPFPCHATKCRRPALTEARSQTGYEQSVEVIDLDLEALKLFD